MTEDSRPTALRTDHQAAEVLVRTDERPQFSWRVPTDRRGACQTEYRILVAASLDALDGRESVVWDSGRVEAGESTGVTYDGPPLSADATYHWIVRVRDENGDPTEWSEPATFRTGPEEPWPGDWIGHQPGPGDSNGYRSAWSRPDGSNEQWVQVDLEVVYELSAVELHPAEPFDGPITPDGGEISAIHARGESDEPMHTRDGATGFGFPVRYRIEAATDPTFEDATVLVDRTADEQANPGSDAVKHDVDATARYVRVVATDCYEVEPAFPNERESRSAWEVFALAALAVRDKDGVDRARGCDVRASSSHESATWGTNQLVNGVYGSEIASTSPLLRTEFELSKPIESARVHVAGLGYAECHVNGDRIGDAVLDPSWTEYDERVEYVTHDVTDELTAGANALGLWLGRGRFSQNFFGWTGFGSPRARAPLVVEYADGTTEEVATGPEWRSAPSPITENDLYDGEVYAAREEQPRGAGRDSTTASGTPRPSSRGRAADSHRNGLPRSGSSRNWIPSRSTREATGTS